MKPSTSIALAIVIAGLALVPVDASADALECERPEVSILGPKSGTQLRTDTVEVRVRVSLETRPPWEMDLSLQSGGRDLALKHIKKGGRYVLTATLEPGTHFLEAVLDDGCYGEVTSNLVRVEVPEPPSPETGDGDVAASGTGGGTTGDPPKVDAGPSAHEAKSGGSTGGQLPSVAVASTEHETGDDATADHHAGTTASADDDTGDDLRDDDDTDRGIPTRWWVALGAFGLAVLGAWRLRRPG